jgi:serine/threonine-protein kinase
MQARVPPQTLGRYRIVGEIGRGAMGVVYRGVDPLLERPVAIKTVNLDEAGDDATEYDARFLQEAKAAGRLAHPNVITVYDVGREGDIAFMAMELLEGRNLRMIIAESRKLPVPQAIRIAAQIADGLAYAHEFGVVHRDIKPGNIMILASGLAKIMDFGIARMRASDVRTKTGILLGSPHYMSPEQLQGDGADPRSDVFALGVVLYEMLTGVTPFCGDSLSSVMYQIATATPPAPSHATAEVPEMLDRIIARALAKKPDERYPGAAELAAELRVCGTRLAEMSSPRQDDGSATLTQSVRHTPQTGVTRPLSSHFDSRHATHKLALATGMEGAYDAHARTLRACSPTPGSAPLRPSPAADSGSTPSAAEPAWNRRERLVLGASVTIAAIVAVFIALA